MTFIATGLTAWWQIFLTHTETEHAEDVSRTAAFNRTRSQMHSALHQSRTNAKQNILLSVPPNAYARTGTGNDVKFIACFLSHQNACGADGQLSREM